MINKDANLSRQHIAKLHRLPPELEFYAHRMKIRG